MKELKVRWAGTSPMVVQRYTKPDDSKTRKKSVEPPAVEKLSLVNGEVQVPNINILMCIRDGAARVIERGRSTYRSTILGLVQVEEQLVPVCDKNGRAYTDTDFDNWTNPMGVWQRGVKRQTGERIFVTSPKIDDWMIEFTLIIDDETVPVKTIGEIMILSGRMMGFGSARQLGFGRFNVKIM